MPTLNLSKTRFLAGLQCEKRLWLDLYQRDLADQTSQATQSVFDQGLMVGQLAQTLFLDGVLIDEDYLHLPQAVQATQKAVAAGYDTLFEAAAQTQRAQARADILRRVQPGANEWDLIEIKSTTRVKEEHFTDLAFQKYVFEGAGYPIRKAILGHLNRNYTRQGPLDLQALFTLSDQTPAVDALLKAVPPQLKRLLKVAEGDQAPPVPIGPHCQSPYDCPFLGHCWKDVPEKSVFTLGGRKTFVWDLYHQGTKLLVDIPDTIRLSSAQRKQIAVAREGQASWKVPAIQKFLERLEYPLSFLDFETVQLAVPPYDGCRPFDALPTQFSLHTLNKTNHLEHNEFLADGQSDPRQPFAEALLKAIPEKGSILIYSPYENRILQETALFLPKLKSRLLGLVGRTVDLAAPFRQQQVLHPDFEGSYSIKVVLPTLVPGMDYDHLAIGDGTAAVAAYLRLMDPKVTDASKKKIRKDLLIYCAQDTLAMVKIVDVLREKVSV
jgi:hypothetical protein